MRLTLSTRTSRTRLTPASRPPGPARSDGYAVGELLGGTDSCDPLQIRVNGTWRWPVFACRWSAGNTAKLSIRLENALEFVGQTGFSVEEPLGVDAAEGDQGGGRELGFDSFGDGPQSEGGGQADD